MDRQGPEKALEKSIQIVVCYLPDGRQGWTLGSHCLAFPSLPPSPPAPPPRGIGTPLTHFILW